MRIVPLTTGHARLKDAFLRARPGPLRQARLFLPGPFSAPMPIHAWVVEDGDRRILVDTGERATVKDLPFCRFEVGQSDELPAVLEAAGLSLADIDTCVLTHLHGDHMNGTIHWHGPVLVHAAELAFARTPVARAMARMFRQPLPDADWSPFALDDGPFGAFAAHKRLSDRVLVVDTPGHTPGHVSVLCVDDKGRHVLLAGDVADSLEQLLAVRADAVSPKPKVQVASLERVLAHAKAHRTVFLPSHDPESVARLQAGTTL